jgi:hypothetical protein
MDTWRGPCCGFHGSALDALVDLTGSEADRDRAIEGLDAAVTALTESPLDEQLPLLGLGDQRPAQFAAQRGFALADRAREAAALDRAIELFAEAAEDLPDADSAAEFWAFAAGAGRQRSAFAHDLDSLERAASPADRAIALTTDDDLVLLIHQEQLFIEHLLADHGCVRTGRARSTPLIVEVLATVLTAGARGRSSARSGACPMPTPHC